MQINKNPQNPNLSNKIENNLKICIIGLGYVGLPLAVEFSKKFPTIGFDNSFNRINDLKNGYDKTLELSDNQLQSSSLQYSTDSKDIVDCDVYIVTVPTPIDTHKNPNMSALLSASKMIGKVLRKGNTVVYESTVYPGATEEFCVPILEKESGLEYNVDFFAGYSPERINPGDKKHNLTTIIKVTSGSNQKTANFVDKLYRTIIPAGTHKVSSIKIAESAKIIENIQRDVNIALINELSMLFHELEIDTSEVLQAASTKWNFLPFHPGLVGGHCIGVDPYYMTHKAKEVGFFPEIILSGRRINDNMGEYIAISIIKEMVKNNINPINAKVAVLGMTFKENCPDIRNTKVPDIIRYLNDYNCNIVVTDPHADIEETKALYDIELIDIKQINNIDCIIIAVAHDTYKSMDKADWLSVLNSKCIFVDIKSILRKDYFRDTGVVHWRL